MAWGLHNTFHVYENLGPLRCWPPPLDELSSAKLIMSDTRPIEICPNHLMVVRPGSVIYDEAFPADVFQFPIKSVFEFVMRKGKGDKTRSTGWRLDISNAGRAFEASETDSSAYRPKVRLYTKLFRFRHAQQIALLI